MNVIRSDSMPNTLMLMYNKVASAPEVEIRGSKCRNLGNTAILLPGDVCPLTNFEDRKLNLEYCKKEWLWYLGANKFDASIEQYATLWKKLKQEDGSYFSNYGQYLFSDGQFIWAIRQLKNDMYTRRASIPLLKAEHLFDENTDMVCTYAINFTIENGYLNMTVMMRSNDVIYGFTNDAFCFWNLMAMAYAILKETYPDLKMGYYTHFTNSLHVYERHYDMIRALIIRGTLGFKHIHVPMPTAREAISLLNSKGKESEGEYSDWLKA